MSKQQEHSSSSQAAIIADGMTLGVVGAGVMGQTLIRGLVASGLVSRDRLWAGDKNGATCENASQELEIPVESDYQGRVATSDLILMCVKPGDAPVVLAALRNAGLRRETLLISILAGVSTDRIEALLGSENPVVRAMPNTPCIVGEGMTVVCRGRYASKADLERARRVFEGVGKCLPVDEVHFNAITALSGSGPGYQFLIMEALADAGVRVGLPRQLALTLVAQTALGAARMVLATGRHPASLRDDVTTPAGCTIAGLLMLEDGRIRSVLARAVEEAAKVAAHLGAAPAKISETAAGHRAGH
ncbi:MAG TPA: pyrroline-5-carboxylate reductase [Bryobacteraceae bacterium]|nr:pyrroline-5-carboxylate reductase [Bryobacteraceae bacterium]